MFEITGDQIALLGDGDLRSLIGLLCEAEARRGGISTAGITWGGHQDAPDGGFDVVAKLSVDPQPGGWLPRRVTGFQVKKPDMSPAAIIKEMKPAGVLRSAILDLAAASGAYVIVCSAGSTSDGALKKRLAAMEEALAGTTAEGKLKVDFFDRNRVASWVRGHPGMVLWVREKIGRAIEGWKPIGNWSRAPDGTASYLADDRLRLRRGHVERTGDGAGSSAVDGIGQLRRALSKPGTVVRLVGLSGVGKTRLAEALFGKDIGEGALDPSWAVYTDSADQPSPSPMSVASNLSAEGASAVLIVDNCSAALHRQIAAEVGSAGSTISLLTIEYDIREDETEGTDVFILEASSDEVVEKLLRQRYPEISQVDAGRIAEFSGGNARLALALASPINAGDNVAALKDEELFQRLFEQRQGKDNSLFDIAGVCSLVYSFNGAATEGDGTELAALGTLIGKTADEVYGAVQDLRARDLVQARGDMRAVLPHAVANRLAKDALRRIPPQKIRSILVDKASERLFRSFTRRLGYLGDSREARELVEGWMQQGDLLSDPLALNELERSAFYNVAPVAPGAALDALERALNGADDEALEKALPFARLLHSLAYEAEHFERVLGMLVRLALKEDDESTELREANGAFETLFHFILSGTHAPLTARIAAARNLLASPDIAVRRLGTTALRALLKADDFSSGHDFAFGAGSRNYGYEPKTGSDVTAWFSEVLRFVRLLAKSNEFVGTVVRDILAQSFQGLWSNTGCIEDLDDLMRDVAKDAFWRDGWVAVRQTIFFDGSTMADTARVRLLALEQDFRPKGLVSRVRAAVLGRAGHPLDLDFDDTIDDPNEFDPDESDEESDRRAREATKEVYELGRAIALDMKAFEVLLPELMFGDYRLVSFADGLAQAAENRRSVWSRIVEQFAKTENASVNLLGGFLAGYGKVDPEGVERLLDDAVAHPVLGAHYPVIQVYMPFTDRSLKRLLSSLDARLAQMSAYGILDEQLASTTVSGPAFLSIIDKILSRPNGARTAETIVLKRIRTDRHFKRQSLPEVKIAAQRTLKLLDLFTQAAWSNDRRRNHGTLIRFALEGAERSVEAVELVRKLKVVVANHELGAAQCDDAIKSLLAVHPEPVLDELFSGDRRSQHTGYRLVQPFADPRTFPLDEVSEDILMAWCHKAPQTRFALAAKVVRVHTQLNTSNPLEWTPIALQLLREAPNPVAVFNALVERLTPMSWGGSRANARERRLALLDRFEFPAGSKLAEALHLARERINAVITAERLDEKRRQRDLGDRFE